MKTLVTDEHLIKDGALPGRVRQEHRVRAPPARTSTVEEFQRYWREVHGPLASEIPVILRYVQSHCRQGRLRERAPTPLRRGRDSPGSRARRRLRESARSDAYARTRADEANFIAPGELPFVITREHVIVA